MSDTPRTDAEPIQFVRVADLSGMERMEPYVPAEAMRRIERAHFQICCGWTDMEVSLHEAKREREEIAALVRRLFELLETVEVSDSEREFHPTYISSCRVVHTMELDKLLPKLKEAAK